LLRATGVLCRTMEHTLMENLQLSRCPKNHQLCLKKKKEKENLQLSQESDRARVGSFMVILMRDVLKDLVMHDAHTRHSHYPDTTRHQLPIVQAYDSCSVSSSSELYVDFSTSD
jgi:hypothetical protein